MITLGRLLLLTVLSLPLTVLSSEINGNVVKIKEPDMRELCGQVHCHPLELEEMDLVVKKYQLVTRASGGSEVYNAIGSSNDLPRTAILGLGVGLIFCSGKCEAYLETNYSTGSRKRIVKTQYDEFQGKVSFIWVPIIISQRFKIGIGPDLTLSSGRLTHVYKDSRLESQVMALNLGINLNMEAHLLSLERNKKSPLPISFGLNGRFYMQDILATCESFSNTNLRTPTVCRKHDALRTMEDTPLTGGGIESSLYLKVVW